jgi:hypothetical protein
LRAPRAQKQKAFARQLKTTTVKPIASTANRPAHSTGRILHVGAGTVPVFVDGAFILFRFFRGIFFMPGSASITVL